jgi:hypothetical protein
MILPRSSVGAAGFRAEEERAAFRAGLRAMILLLN